MLILKGSVLQGPAVCVPLAAGPGRGLVLCILLLPAPAPSPVPGRVQSLARPRSAAEEAGSETEDSTELKGTKKFPQLEWCLFLLGTPGGVGTLYHRSLSKASNYLCVCLKGSLLMWAETSGPGPAPHDTKQASAALGSPAQDGLGGAASSPERVGSFPCNEID